MRRSEGGQEEHRDHEIERVLKGLREVEAPVGIERRVLERMRAAADGRRPGVRAGWSWLPAAGVLAMVLLVLAGVGGIRWRKGEAGRVVMRARVPAEAAAREGRTVGGGMESARLPGMPAPLMKRGRGGREVRVSQTRQATAQVTGAFGAEARREEMVAVEEMRAPSLVAPALPLTREERLLQRVAQRGGAEEMAALNPDERAKEIATGRAEFRKFFGPARWELIKLNGERHGDDDATN